MASGQAKAFSAKFDPGREGYQDSYIFVCCDNQSFMSNTNGAELERVKSLRVKLGKDFVWIRHHGKPCLIRDEDTVRQARVLWSNYEAQMAEVRERTAEDELAEQARINAVRAVSSRAPEKTTGELPELTNQLQKLEAELKKLHQGSSPEEFDSALAELNLLQAKLRAVQASTLAMQAQTGVEEASVRETTEALRAKQDETWKQVKNIGAEANQRMLLLIDNALAHGLALPETTSPR